MADSIAHGRPTRPRRALPFSAADTALFAIAGLVLVPIYFWRPTRTVENIHAAVHAVPPATV